MSKTDLDIVLDICLDISDNAPMTRESYKKTFNSALQELADLSRQRNGVQTQLDELDERIEKVRQGALGLSVLAGIDFQEIKTKYPDLFEEQIDARMGITDAIREALRTEPDMLTPMEIRDKVFQISPAIAGHKNPLASIHAVLRRLQDRNEVAYAIQENTDKTMYGWIGADDWKKRLKRWIKNADESIERVTRERERQRRKNGPKS